MNDEIYECCVLCGKILSIKKDLPVSKRQNYIEGAGQLCEECMKIINTVLKEKQK